MKEIPSLKTPLVESSLHSLPVAVFRLSSGKHRSCMQQNREPFLVSHTSFSHPRHPLSLLFFRRLCRNSHVGGVPSELQLQSRKTCYPLCIFTYIWVCESALVCLARPSHFLPVPGISILRDPDISQRCDYVCKSMRACLSVLALSPRSPVIRAVSVPD